jgi:hypothetical protein
MTSTADIKVMKKGDNKRLAKIAKDIKALEKSTISNAIEIGELLHEVSETCEHGVYQAWLKREFCWSYQTALNYRNVYEFDANSPPKNPTGWVFGSVDDLNISMSALYLVAGMKRDDQQPARLAIIEAAKVRRVSYSMAKRIIAETDDPEPDEDEDDDDKAPVPDKPAPDSDDGTPPTPKPAAAPAPDSADDIKDNDQEEPGGDYQTFLAQAETHEPVQLLRRLNELLCHQQHRDWTTVIAAVTPIKVREIIEMLKDALDEHGGRNAIQAAADRAEARKAT